MENRNTQLTIGGLVVGGMLLSGFLAVAVVPKALVTLTKAAPTTKVSLTNSYVLGSKILAKADGKDSCEVNVFVLDADGHGLKDKTVSLTGVDGVKATTMKTGSDGKITFKISSITEGQFEMTAAVSGVPLPKTIKVTFRK